MSAVIAVLGLYVATASAASPGSLPVATTPTIGVARPRTNAPLTAPLGVEVSAFAATSIQLSARHGSTDFRVDTVALRFGRSFEDLATARVALTYRSEDQRFARSRGRSLSVDDVIGEAWISADILRRETGLTLRIGKFALPFGTEPYDREDAPLYSRSYTTAVGRPSFGTGAWLRHRADTSPLDVSFFVIGGWDAVIDEHAAKSVGGRIAISSGRLVLGAGYAGGIEPVPNRDGVAGVRHALDFDASLRIDGITASAELAWIHHERGSQILPDRPGRWLSLLGTVSFDLADWLVLTTRYEHADDPDASRLVELKPQTIGASGRDSVAGLSMTVDSASVGLAADLTSWARVLLEWRSDFLPRSEDTAIFGPEDDSSRAQHLLFLSAVASIR